MHIGIDLGGTKIEIVALDENGENRYRKRVATPHGDYQATIRTIKILVEELESELGGGHSLGIGTPGSLDAKQRIKNANSTCLNGRNLKKDLQQELQRRVTLENDANCLVYSECRDGAAQGHSVVFAAIIGTGTGAGIAVNGTILTGANHLGGEWGHNPLPWPGDDERPGPPCYCGKRGCIETWLSGPGLSRYHEELTGKRLKVEDINTMAQQGDVHCEHSLTAYEDRLARSLAHVINIIDPHIIILGGGMSNLARLYGSLPERIKPYVFSPEYRLNMVPAKHGDASGVRGAAWLGQQAQ